MVCQTLKTGAECIFMTKTGCGYNGGKCYTIVEQCENCDRIIEFATGKFCSAYAEPRSRWGNSPCNFATHIKKETEGAHRKTINALKASKRKAAGKM